MHCNFQVGVLIVLYLHVVGVICLLYPVAQICAVRAEDRGRQCWKYDRLGVLKYTNTNTNTHDSVLFIFAHPHWPQKGKLRKTTAQYEACGMGGNHCHSVFYATQWTTRVAQQRWLTGVNWWYTNTARNQHTITLQASFRLTMSRSR